MRGNPAGCYRRTSLAAEDALSGDVGDGRLFFCCQVTPALESLDAEVRLDPIDDALSGSPIDSLGLEVGDGLFPIVGRSTSSEQQSKGGRGAANK